MGLVVSSVREDSIAASLPVAAGDTVLAANGTPIRDLIDYSFALAGEYVELRVKKVGGEELVLEIDKEYDEDIGLVFDQPFPQLRRCQNRCLFCFLDQMPPGLRPSLYINDDDYRLSFWEGNFITLTNAGPHDLERIASQRLNPLYISVHTTNPSLRKQMLQHPRAGLITQQLAFLKSAGIEMHTQIVLCPGINDGQELDKTITDLAGFWPQVRSIAIVPVGLTRFRRGLYPLKTLSRDEASALVDKVERWQRQFMETLGDPLVYAADEVYLKAGAPVPPAELYGEYPQLENGVGLVRQYLDALKIWLGGLTKPLGAIEKITVVSGTLAAPIVQEALRPLRRIGLDVRVVPIRNNFFGPTVTVTGLLPGKDIVGQLKGKDLGRLVVIPGICFNDDGLTLDGLTVADLEEMLGKPVSTSRNPRDWIRTLKQKVEPLTP
ncbi:MAG: DUF512 domain-containing protein [Bacillota bacterium]